MAVLASSVIPAKAGTHLSTLREMGPRFRGDDSEGLGETAMLALGLMSGTSMDGIDATLIDTDGEAAVRRIAFATTPYDEPFRARLRDAMAAALVLDAAAAATR